MAKIVSVSVDTSSLDDAAVALVAGDGEAVGKHLDAVFTFEGVGGTLIELVDGPVFSALGEGILLLFAKALEKMAGEDDSE
jgi:hypothetical protein